MPSVDVKAAGLSDVLCVCSYLCACVFLGSDETLSLTRCCSVKVKPYRMSGMMTRTERFHLIPPFPFFPSIPPICPPHPLLYLRPRPTHSQDETDIYRPSPRVCIKTLRGCVGQCVHVCALHARVCVCVCVNSVKSCYPTSKANSEAPEATVCVSVWLAWSLQPAVKHLRFSLQKLHIYCYLPDITQWDF